MGKLRFVLPGVVALLAFGASTAMADVFVFAEIDKHKDKTVTETLTKTKIVTLDVVVLRFPDKFAESEAVANQFNDGNEACENCAEKRDQIVDSVGSTANNNPGGNTGITTVNQAGGNMNNQGTAIAIAVDVCRSDQPECNAGDGGDGPTPGTGFAEAQATAQQVNTNNNVDSVAILFRDGWIINSVNGNTGVTYVNQAVGQMNNQLNALSIAISFSSGVALAEADLGQVTSDNTVLEAGVVKTALIQGSVSGNSGITGVNQGSGNMANQANVIAMGFAGTDNF